MATIRILELRDNIRFASANFPKLSVGDQVLVRVYDIAPLRAVNRAGSVAMAVKVGEAPPETLQPT